MESINQSNNNFEQCIKCTVCTVYCPVLQVNPDFPGPKHGGPDGERLRLKKANYYDEALKLCLNCKRCEVACPSNVRIGDIIQSARIKYSKKKPKVRDFILANTDLMGTLVTPFAPIVNPILKLGITRATLDGVLNIDRHRIFPKYAHGTFEGWMKKQAKSQQKFDKQLSYFHGCYVNYNNPQLGKDLVKVFNALGYGIQLLRKEKCCGVALISNGFINQAKKQGEINLKSIRESVIDKKMPVIATSSTCTFTIRDEYPHLLKLKNADVRDSVELATRFIYRLMTTSDAIKKLKFKSKTIKVGYHVPCHMEKMGWQYYTIELLKLIPNIEVKLLDPGCCGIAGTYGFKKENYQTSQKIGAPLFKEIEESGIDYVVSDCETCKWQIEMSTSKSCVHPISIFAEALEQ